VNRDNQTKNETLGESRGVVDDSAGSQVSQDIAEYVQRTTKEQGVPEKVQDATAIGRLALMVKRPTRSSRKPDQTAKIAT
jgi:hypothetical protein